MSLLSQARAAGASDLHLHAGRVPLIRRDGRLQPLPDGDALPERGEGALDGLLAGWLSEPQRWTLQSDLELDCALTDSQGGRYRMNAYHCDGKPAAAIRILPDRVPTLADIDAPPALARLAEQEHGLILVVGATGSGKSTTLAALVDHLMRTRPRHLLTIEDPVEYVHRPPQGLVTHRELHRDTRSFSAALRSALREDPDVILVGEMRDPETIALALTAAETGHLVLSTLHTGRAAGAIDRILDAVPAGDKAMTRAMLGSSLLGVVAQRLLRRPGGGRVAAYEVLVGTPAVRALIREDKTVQLPSAMQTGQRFGMQTLEASVAARIAAGLADPAEAARVARPDGADVPARAVGGDADLAPRR